ncbi:MAG: dipeptide epimerase [Alphaproteobacteria bacterium]|jgi:L-alanine-DL-glutamate epimerase-like enolase superfamily enzyme|nr:dipeptide epimerase [Alphaproteobacteria bacterium]
MSRRIVSFAAERWPIAGEFRIARGARTHVDVVLVRVDDGEGECVPYKRYGETVESVLAQLEGVRGALENGGDALALLPPGAARNGIDSALLDAAAKKTGVPVWQQLGLMRPEPALTAYTLSIDTPDAMAAKGAGYPLLKIKVGGETLEADLARLEAIHAANPSAKLIVDANEGWSLADCRAALPVLQRLPLVVLEQPLPASDSAALAELRAELPIFADESFHTADDIATVLPWARGVNVKLDKAGGVRPVLAAIQAARAAGLSVMLGCMLATSRSMLAAFCLSSLADVLDLDGPLLLAMDVAVPAAYKDKSFISLPDGGWGQ